MSQRPEPCAQPIVIAHRGASGYRPEHTLEGYRLAIEQGADFIEPDLVATGDGVLIARHENEISGTTDVAARAEFEDRRTSKVVDGVSVTGWFTEDFTLAEIKSLRARERIPEVRRDNARFDGALEIPTFAEVVQLAAHANRGGRRVGVYPETKHPTYFASEGKHLDGTPIGLSLGGLLIDTLVAEGFTDPRRVLIQSFEVANLLELKRTLMPKAGVEFPLVQLFGDLATSMPYDIAYALAHGTDFGAVYGGLATHIASGSSRGATYAALSAPPALGWMHTHYAAAIGARRIDLFALDQSCLASPVAKGSACGPPIRAAMSAVTAQAGAAAVLTGTALPLLDRAHAAHLPVHAYTLRKEPQFLARTATGERLSANDEALLLFRLGVQGIFIDQPDIGVAARERFLRESGGTAHDR